MRAVHRYKQNGVLLQCERCTATTKCVQLKNSGDPLQRKQHCETVSELAANHHGQAARLNLPREAQLDGDSFPKVLFASASPFGAVGRQHLDVLVVVIIISSLPPSCRRRDRRRRHR